MKNQRMIIGVLGIVCAVIGAYLAISNHGQNHSLSGILVRVGLMLCATWLALPSLMHSENQRSLKFGVLMVGVLILVAMRPRILILALLVGGVAWVVNWSLKKLSTKNQ